VTDEPLRYRREITPELAARAAPELERLFQWWNDRWHETVGARRRAPLRVIRWLGLSLSLLGVVVAGAAVVLTPDAPCPRGRSVAFYNAVIPVFVVFATVFGFMERVSQELRAFGGRVAARQARRVAARTAGAAPYAAEYVVRDGRLETRAEALKRSSASDLRRFERAAFARDAACLFGARRLFPVKRILWLPEDGARERLREALRAAGVEVTDLGPDAPA
jgi:hypothetical protein